MIDRPRSRRVCTAVRMRSTKRQPASDASPDLFCATSPQVATCVRRDCSSARSPDPGEGPQRRFQTQQLTTELGHAFEPAACPTPQQLIHRVAQFAVDVLPQRCAADPRGARVAATDQTRVCRSPAPRRRPSWLLGPFGQFGEVPLRCDQHNPRRASGDLLVHAKAVRADRPFDLLTQQFVHRVAVAAGVQMKHRQTLRRRHPQKPSRPFPPVSSTFLAGAFCTASLAARYGSANAAVISFSRAITVPNASCAPSTSSSSSSAARRLPCTREETYTAAAVSRGPSTLHSAPRGIGSRVSSPQRWQRAGDRLMLRHLTARRGNSLS